MAALIAACLGATPNVAAADRIHSATEPGLEQLLQAEGSWQSGLPGQITTATSAVVVVTRSDIERLGLRSLSQVLDHMRGLHVVYGPGRTALAGRGAGGSSGLSGRILVLIDGHEAARSLLGELQIGADALVDVDLIDRVEYAPGSGAALYGGDALFGIVHVVTRQGRDLAGLQPRIRLGSWGERSGLLSWGGRSEQAGEWLGSVSADRNDGSPSPDVGPAASGSRSGSERGYFKWQRQGIWFSALGIELRDGQDAPDNRMRRRQRTVSLKAGLDQPLAAGWHHALTLALGEHRDDIQNRVEGERLRNLQLALHHRWWSADQRLTYQGLHGHSLTMSWRLQGEPQGSVTILNETEPPVDIRDSRRQFGMAIEDAIRLGDDWLLTLGVRREQRSGTQAQWNPRLGLAWQASPSWAVKLSTGRSSRYPFLLETPGQLGILGESASTQEAVIEYAAKHFKLDASVYSFRSESVLAPGAMNAPSSDAFSLLRDPARAPSIRNWGIEFGAVYEFDGWKASASLGWRSSEPSESGDAPTSTTKLAVSGPLIGEAWRLGATYRRSTFDSTGTAEFMPNRPIPDRVLRDLVNVQLIYRPRAADWDVRLGLGNLLGRADASYRQSLPETVGGSRRALTLELRTGLQ